MIDLERLSRDLQEVTRAIAQGHLTRAELITLKLDLGWAMVTCRRALDRGLTVVGDSDRETALRRNGRRV